MNAVSQTILCFLVRENLMSGYKVKCSFCSVVGSTTSTSHSSFLCNEKFNFKLQGTVKKKSAIAT